MSVKGKTLIDYPPDPYEDVYSGASCVGLPMEEITPLLCGACPVKRRCHDLYEDLQFGSLILGDAGKLASVLTGTWGGVEYDMNEHNLILRDGVAYARKDRPKRKEWA